MVAGRAVSQIELRVWPLVKDGKRVKCDEGPMVWAEIDKIETTHVRDYRKGYMTSLMTFICGNPLIDRISADLFTMPEPIKKFLKKRGFIEEISRLSWRKPTETGA
jgi:hypothetical protein